MNRWISERTGWLHYDGPDFGDPPHQAIAVYENLLYCLSLMRMKEREKIEEAGERLRRLLPFCNGEFPVHLHEFPNCFDKRHAAKILHPLYWIQKLFLHVLPLSLQEGIKACIKTHLTVAAAHYDASSDPLHRFRTRTLLKAFGKTALNPEEIAEEALMNPHNLGHFLCLAQLDPDTPFPYELAISYWDEGRQIYGGPAYECPYRGAMPERTLYELMMTRERFCNPLFEEALVVQPLRFVKPTASPYKIAYTSIKPKQPKWYSPFRILWGSPTDIGTLFLHAPDCTVTWDSKQLLLALPDSSGERERPEVEFAFYATRSLDVKILVAGASTTTFSFEDLIEIHTPTLQIQLKFHLLKGSGDFSGHIHPSASPLRRRRERDNGSDHRLFMRTLRRGEALIGVDVQCVLS